MKNIGRVTVGKVEPTPKIWLSVKETQAYLGCGKDYIYRLINEARVRAARDGKMTFVFKASLDAYLKSLSI